MRIKYLFVLVFLGVQAFGQDRQAPKHEIALTLGGLFSGTRTGGPTSLELGSGVALQANYGYRLWQADNVAL